MIDFMHIFFSLDCDYRDYICYHFHKNRFVDKAKMKAVLRLPMQELTAIFKELSKPDPKHDGFYEFIFPSDMDFVNRSVVPIQLFLNPFSNA